MDATERSRKGVELAYERLRAAIVENRYEPGRRLVEQRLAEELQVSRTPVREAIRRLEAEGLVVSERNRGAAVRSISVDEVHDLYELRARLESYAAELAAARATPSEIEALRGAADRFASACDDVVRGAGDLGRVNEANRDVHDRIVGASHHVRLAAMLRRTVDVPLVFRAFAAFGADELRRSDLFHHLIVDAISRGDGASSARLMAEHIVLGRDAVVAGLAGRDQPEA